METENDMPQELTHYIFSFLSQRHLILIQSVNKEWEAISNQDGFWQLPAVGINNKQELLNRLKQFSLPKVICSNILDGRFSQEQLLRLFTLLSLNKEQREEQIDVPNVYSSSSRFGRKLTSNEVIIALALELMTSEQIRSCFLIINGNSFWVALLEGLVTAEQVKEAYENNSDATIILFDKKNGLIALREKLITIEQASCFKTTKRRDIYSDEKWYQNNLHYMLSENGLQALREKLISPNQAITIYYLKHLLSNNGLQALREGLITPEQASKVWDLSALLSDKGLQALQTHLITSEQAIPIHGLDHLISDNGFKALREGLITPEQATTIRCLSDLLSDKGLQAMREGLISPEQAAEFSNDRYQKVCKAENLKRLLSERGLHALREKLITPEQAATVENLDRWLSENIKESSTSKLRF